MSDHPSSVSIQCPQYNSAQTSQPLGGLDHELGSTEHLLGTNPTGPHPALNHANAARYSGTMRYDDLPHLATHPGEYQGSLPQLEGQSTTGVTQFIPIVPVPPQPDFYTPAPGSVHYGMPVTEDLRNLASRYLHNPGSHVDKLRMTRSRSGAVKVLIWLGVPIFSGPPQLGNGAPAIPEVSNDGHPSHVPFHHSVARPSPEGSGIGYSMHSRISITENLKDLASYYLHNPGSRVGKLRMRQNSSGVAKLLILLEIDGTM